jgi:pimeloyl-ACP methyl ester carboxylesterase
MTMMTGIWIWVTHYWAALAIAGTCLSLLLFVVLLLLKYVRIALNIFMDTSPPLLMGGRDFQVIQGEEVRFRSFDGTSLRGMWLRGGSPPQRKGTIIFCHEYGSDMYSCARYARPLMEAGFEVFTFDFRGHGESSGPRGFRPLQWPSDKELEDVLGACAHVADALQSAGRQARIGLFGISRGAGTAILAASSDPNVACLVCDGAFSTRQVLVSLMKRWADIFAAHLKVAYKNQPEAFWQLLLWWMLCYAQPKLGRRFPSVRRALENMIPRPILFIHGERDSYIRPEQTQILYHAADQPKYLWIVPQAKHNQSVVVAPKEYAARTVAFFGKYLAGEDVSLEAITGGLAESHVA